jgi:TfoX/Sxy family transcriptional regulator of competence genes
MAAMTRDELIAAVRRALEGERGLTEKKMFGGVGFFLNGNMLAGTAGGQFADLLMLRVGKDAEAAALAEPHTRPVEMRGRRIGGYVFVESAALADRKSLKRWLRRALEHVATLPRKQARSNATKTKKRAPRNRGRLR